MLRQHCSISRHLGIDVAGPGGDTAAKVDHAPKALLIEEARDLLRANTMVADDDDRALAVELFRGRWDLSHRQELACLEAADGVLPGLTNIKQERALIVDLAISSEQFA